MNNSLLRIYFLRKVSLACAKHSPRARIRGRTYYTNFVGKASVRRAPSLVWNRFSSFSCAHSRIQIFIGQRPPHYARSSATAGRWPSSQSRKQRLAGASSAVSW